MKRYTAPSLPRKVRRWPSPVVLEHLASDLDYAPEDAVIQVGVLRNRLRRVAGQIQAGEDAQGMGWAFDTDGRYFGQPLIEENEEGR